MKLKVRLRVFERSVKPVFVGVLLGNGAPVLNGFLGCGKGTQSSLVCLAAELDSYCRRKQSAGFTHTGSSYVVGGSLHLNSNIGFMGKSASLYT